MPKNLYSVPPPRDLLLKAVRSLGFDDLQDTRWIDESHSNTLLMDEVKTTLRQYLYPCLTKRYLDKEEFSYKDYLTVVRQLLRHYKRKLLYKEKCKTVGARTYKYVFTYSLDPDVTSKTVKVVTFNLPSSTDTEVSRSVSETTQGSNQAQESS